MIRILLISSFLGVSVLNFSTVNAQQSDNENAISRLQKCQLIQIDKPRLACYDQTIFELTGAIESKDILVINKSEIENAQIDSFGKNEDPSAQLNKIIEKDEIDDQDDYSKELVSRIVNTEVTARNRMKFFLENGQVWEQTQSDSVYMSKKKQYTAHIKKARISGYGLRLNDKGSLIRVKRIK